MAGEELHLDMQKSEIAVLHAASRVYAACVAKGEVDSTNEEEYVEKCVRLAMKMAYKADRLVLSDDEI